MTDEPAPRATRSFDVDRPIERREHDELGRRSWAEAIAREIDAAPAEQGFTVALVGAWGSGKTSVLNMVVEAIKNDDSTTPVLNFNPWLFGGAAELVTRFFGELSAQLGQSSYQTLKDVAKALASFGQGLAPLIPVPGVGLLTTALGAVDRSSSRMETARHWTPTTSDHLSGIRKGNQNRDGTRYST